MSTVPDNAFSLTTVNPSNAALVDDARTLIDCFHRDLISFLSIARFYKVDFLPMTWDDRSSALGRGATGDVMQSTINLESSYAFKLFKKPNKDAMFRELISEVVLLGQASISAHPNIVDLEGITFQLDDDTEDIWPILVFKRAHFGSLRMFMDSKGKEITFEQKLRLCSEVGSAIQAMHNIDVIHGDIKPENILVFGESISNFTARVTDFGYSCMGAKDKTLVYPPKSEEWCAPEYHRRGVQIHRAKKMDIYSFAMLCFWILFREDFRKLRASLDFTRNRDEFRHCAMDVASSAESLGSELREFFDLTLREDWQTREDDLGRLLLLFGQEIWRLPPTTPTSNCSTNPGYIKYPETFRSLVTRLISRSHGTGSERRLFLSHLDTFDREISQQEAEDIVSSFESFNKALIPTPSFEQDIDGRYSLIHNCFNVTDVIDQLRHMGYRVRTRIAASLEEKATDDTCEPCSSQAAFQMAFCYSIGFGVRSNPDKAEHWLHRSSEGRAALESYIHRLKHMLPNEFLSKRFSQIAEQGAFKAECEHANGQELERIESYSEGEITDLENCLGPNHFLSLEMRHALILTKRRLGKSGEAIDIARQLKKASETIVGLEHPFTIMAICDLAEQCRLEWKWEEAESLALEAKRIAEKVLDPQSSVALLASQILCQIYHDNGRNNEWEELHSNIVRTDAKVHGTDPFSELEAISNAGWRNLGDGNLDAAEDLITHAKREFEQLMGPDHIATIMTTRNLALTYRNQGRMTEAERMQVALEKTAEKALGPDRFETFDVSYDLARTYQMQKRWTEAAEILLKVKEGRLRIYGPNNEKTIMTDHVLEEIYMELTSLGDERALTRLKGAAERILGDSSHEALAADRALGIVYLRQGQLQQAEQLMAGLIERSKKILGPEHLDTLGTMSNIGQVYIGQGRLREAETILLNTVQKMERVLGSEHQYTKNTTEALITTYLAQEEFEKAFAARYPMIHIAPPAASTGMQSLPEMDEEERLLSEAIAMSLGLFDFNELEMGE